MAALNDTTVTQFDIERKGWKYVGYRGFSQFLASDNDFLVLRRFSALHTRTLLALQDELVQLESDLDNIDSTSSAKSQPDCHNGTFRADHSVKRQELLKDVRQKLAEYGETRPDHVLHVYCTDCHVSLDELLIRFQNVRMLPRASHRNISSVQNWLYNNGDPILPAEVQYLNTKADLVEVIPKPKSSLRLLLEKSQTFRISWLWRLKQEDLLAPDIADNADVILSSDERIEWSISLAILFFGLVMLIAPLWILNSIAGDKKRLGAITAFVVSFVCLIAFTTIAKPFESLAAAAAYSAVLMVFMQISSSSP